MQKLKLSELANDVEVSIEELEEQVKQLQQQQAATDSHAPEGRNYSNAQYVDLLVKYNQAVEVLKRVDTYIDFSVSLVEGELGIEDIAGINSAFYDAHDFLSSLSQEGGSHGSTSGV